MTEYLQVWRANVAEGNVGRLLELRPAAIAEAQRLCHELLGADLVRLEDGTWRPGRSRQPVPLRPPDHR